MGRLDHRALPAWWRLRCWGQLRRGMRSKWGFADGLKTMAVLRLIGRGGVQCMGKLRFADPIASAGLRSRTSDFPSVGEPFFNLQQYNNSTSQGMFETGVNQTSQMQCTTTHGDDMKPKATHGTARARHLSHWAACTTPAQFKPLLFRLQRVCRRSVTPYLTTTNP